MPTILEKAVEEYRRARFLEEANQAYAALRADPEAWQAELEERAAWDATLADGRARRGMNAARPARGSRCGAEVERCHK